MIQPVTSDDSFSSEANLSGLVQRLQLFTVSLPIQRIALAIILALGGLLPISPLVSSPLHHDEALYGYWARLIAEQGDTMLNSVPVDKPPLFIYLLALLVNAVGYSETIARLPSLVAHIATIWLTFHSGQRLYTPSIGLLAALLVAISPYSILFASTSLTDPLMVTFVMLSVWAASQKKPLLAGVGLALAAATKQQGIFFLPLTLGILLLVYYNGQRLDIADVIIKPQSQEDRKERTSGKDKHLISVAVLQFIVTVIIGLAIPLIWDMNRMQRPGFWLQSSVSYGGLTPAIPDFANRLGSFMDLLWYVTASWQLNLIFRVGLIFLLSVGVLRGFRKYDLRVANITLKFHHQTDILLALFCLLFIVLHVTFTFQVWDRYLLGLVPLLSLLLARILHLPSIVWRLRTEFTSIVASTIVIISMVNPIRAAINAEYPLGGDHGAYAGATETAAYLRGHAGANVTLYHRWLGTHWRLYLFNFPYDLRFWQSADDLASQAVKNANGIQYIAFPSWQSSTSTQLALSDVGLTLTPVFETYQPDGAPALFLYKIASIP